MRRRIFALTLILLLLSGSAMAEGMISASVQVRASRNVYDSVIRAGEDVDMSVRIDGFEPSAYQWYRDGQPIEGQNYATMYISAADVSDTGMYRMDALDANGRVCVSADVALRVVDDSLPKTGDSRLPRPLLIGGIASAALALCIAAGYKAVKNRAN